MTRALFLERDGIVARRELPHEVAVLPCGHYSTGAAPFNRWVEKLADKVAPGRPLEAVFASFEKAPVASASQSFAGVQSSAAPAWISKGAPGLYRCDRRRLSVRVAHLSLSRLAACADPPARAVVGASNLPMGALVEIDAVVALTA